MNSIPFFDDRYPVKTVYTDNADRQGFADWHLPDARNVKLQEYLQTPLKQFHYARESHSGNVLVISEEAGACIEACEKVGAGESPDGYDALVTAEPGILLCIWTADCVPLFLYDTEKHVAAIAHCGWRNICSGIVPHTVNVMAERFCSSAESIVAAFGPGICGRCYEVGDELVEAFSKRFSADEMGELFSRGQNGKHHLDLRKAILLELSRMAVQPQSVYDVGICSYESEEYPSFRRNGSSVLSKLTLSGIVLAE